MIAAQLIACHNASMECYRRAMIGEQTFEGRRENLSQANKLSRTYATLLEALNRHRGKGQQKVTVEHVHVHRRPGRRRQRHPPGGWGHRNQRINPMHLNPDPSPMLRAPRCRATSKRSGKPCRAPAVRGKAVCRMHGAAAARQGQQQRPQAWPLHRRGDQGPAGHRRADPRESEVSETP